MTEQSYESKVMNIPTKKHEGMFATHSHWVPYIEGHRDARHAAAEHAAQADARIAELKASIAAIHCRVKFGPEVDAACLKTLVEECEHVVPELAALGPKA